jgi:hypothetical protein
MTTINLLPWRERLRTQRMQIKLRLYGFGMLLFCIAVGVGLFWFLPVTTQAAVMPDPISVVDKVKSDLQKVRFVGYVHQQHRTWGLLLLPDGKTEDVQVGAVVGNDGARVRSIDEKHLVFMLPNHSRYTLTLSGI